MTGRSATKAISAVSLFIFAFIPAAWATDAFQEAGGQVVMEAEHFDSHIPRGGQSWDAKTSQAGFSGAGYLEALPNSGTFLNSGYVGTSPELFFNIQFTATGTYFVWVRGSGPSGSDDTVHAGVDSTGPTSADRMSGFSTGWTWSRGTLDTTPANLIISTPGSHTIHLWMREDGFKVDKLLLRKSTSSTPPGGTGPAESPRVTVDESPPALDAIDAVSFSPTGAIITWHTNEPATTQVEYGLTDSYGESSSFDAVLVASHHAILSGLTPGTEYHFRVKSQDGTGNLGTSTDQGFITLAEGEGAGVPSGFSIIGDTAEAPPGYAPNGVIETGTDAWNTSIGGITPVGYLSGAAALNHYVFVIGGSLSTTTILNEVLRYDAFQTSWLSVASMPTARDNLTAETINDKVYAFGGSASIAGVALDAVEEYDPLANTWATKASMPTPRYSLASAVLDDKVYVIGGVTTGNAHSAAVEIYDPATNTWTSVASLPTPRWSMAAAQVNGKIYAFGGTVIEGVTDARVEEYDPVANAWSSKAPMPTPRRGARAAVVDSKIYVVGGYSEVGGVLSTVEVYDPATDTWAPRLPMPTARQFPAVAVLGNSIYVVAGSLGSPDIGVTEIFEPRIRHYLHKKK